MRLAERLAGKRILLTGVTGFVGEALLHKLLAEVPDARLVVLVRPKQGQSAADRVTNLLRKPIFADVAGGLRRSSDDELSDDEARAALRSRVEVLSGDLGAVPELPRDLDVVVHCAGDVSFDPPIHEAFATNVVGVKGLVDRVVEAARLDGAADGAPAHRPVHYVHVSTAYVAGRRRGPVPEASVDHTVDWRAELAAADRVAESIEDASRRPALLARFLREAEREHGRAGPLTAAADAEDRRRTWVADQQKTAGGERARTLGWTDVYTFTKSLGERVVEEVAGPVLPTTIYRPSIIESALATPHPGWIEGFKMADPLILAFGRGELPELPAAPDMVMDIVPIDLVVNSIVAAAASPPPPAQPAYFHLASGSRNPLTFTYLYEKVREYFAYHPFDMDARGAVRLPEWRFPGARGVERALVAGERAHRLAERALSLAPRSERVRSIARDLDRQKRRLDFFRRYIDLYRPYVQAEVSFVDDRMLALHQALDPDDLAVWGFDTAVVDWRHYLVEVHCPAVTKAVRDYDVVRRKRQASGGPKPRSVTPRDPAAPADEGPPVLAVFDMDGTLLSSNVVETYLWVRLPELGAVGRAREIASVAARLPSYLQAERVDRGGFLRAAYRRYEGASLAALEELVDETLTPHVLERTSGEALRRVREHRAAGHRTVLITGAVRPLTRPLAPLFDEIVAADLAVDAHGRCTGFLTRPPLVGEGRAAWLRRYAAQVGADLSRAYAYADSHSDLPLLQAVGLPTAVRPDVTLYRAARKARWPIEGWRTPAGVNRATVPAIDTHEARLPG